MEELVTKGPNRFVREKEVRVLLEEAGVLGTTEKGLEGRQRDGQEWGKNRPLKYICGVAVGRKGV